MYIFIPKIAVPLADGGGSILRVRDKTNILYLQHILLRHSIAFVQRQGKLKSRSEGQGGKEGLLSFVPDSICFQNTNWIAYHIIYL